MSLSIQKDLNSQIIQEVFIVFYTCGIKGLYTLLYAYFLNEGH